MLKMKSLAESLESRYTLNEKYDSSVPEWFKYVLDNNIDNVKRNLLDINDTALDKMKFIEAPIPDKVPRITKNQQIIPVFAFRDPDLVYQDRLVTDCWAKGVNDDYCPDNFLYADGQKRFYQRSGRDTYGNMKRDHNFFDSIVGYGYIKLDDPALGERENIRQIRRELRDELNQIPNYRRESHVPKGEWDDDQRYDKSGYRRTNANDRKQKSKELQRNKIFDTLDDYIEDTKGKISSYKFVLADMLTETDNIGMLGGIRRAISNLENMSSNLNGLIKDYGYMDFTKPEQVEAYKYIVENYKDSIDLADKEIREYIDDREMAIVDWI